jgi:hypothetical protein
MVDVLDPGDERRELLDGLARVGVAVHEVLEVVGDVRERHLLIAAIVPETLNAVRRHVPVSSTVRLLTPFPGTRRGNRPEDVVSGRAARGTHLDTGLLAVSEGG